MRNKAQVTIFIILAIVIAGAVIGYFAISGKLGISSLPASFRPIEASFLDCISQKAETGKEILSSGGGYIEMPEFEPGSSYSPFSSQLNFFGGIQYWGYLSGSNIWKEKVPSRASMQSHLSEYIEGEIGKCSFSEFEEQGFAITLGKPKAEVSISDYEISVKVNSELLIEKENEKARQASHEISLKSKLGKMHSEALEIYNREKSELFLENYALDVLRLYAPVDGVEISCAPKIWMPEKVISELKSGLEANIGALRTKGNEYKEPEKKYFNLDIASENSVNFMFSQNWASRIEVWPAEGGIMMAEPVGNQEGLGILGFCYVPYHFVYDVYIPVLVQIYDQKELFQFPVAVIIDKNKPREGIGGDALEKENDLCKYKNTRRIVYTYNSKLEPVEADISFKCFDTECYIGKTLTNEDYAVLEADFPQCVNGFIQARAEGYSEKLFQTSTNEEGIDDVILSKLYNVSVEVEINGKPAENAIVYFSGKEHSASLVWPEQKEIYLIEGEYNISMQAYRNSSLVFPATSERKCVEIPKPGILGLFGGKSEQCFNIDIPSQQITNVLAGGGKGYDYFTEDRLEKRMKISGEALPVPSSLEELQSNYGLFETKRIIVANE